MTAGHDDRVREQFRIQAETFTDDGWAVWGLEWIVDQLQPRSGDQALDVAAGAAHLGRALAPHVRHVSALDLTPEMLAQGQELADRAGLRNVAFLLGNATALPWLDNQFDLVVCRVALHQVADPAAVVREMVRVTRPTGRVGVIDIVTDEKVRAETDRLERLRDPSHGTTLTSAEIHGLLTASGARVVSTATRDHPLDLEDWMRRTATPEHTRAELRQRFQEEIDGGAITGLRPSRGADGTVRILHTWATIVAGGM